MHNPPKMPKESQQWALAKLLWDLNVDRKQAVALAQTARKLLAASEHPDEATRVAVRRWLRAGEK